MIEYFFLASLLAAVLSREDEQRLEEVFVWLDVDTVVLLLEQTAPVLPAGTRVLAEPGDGSVQSRSGLSVIRVRGSVPVRVFEPRLTPVDMVWSNGSFITTAPVSLEGMEFLTQEGWVDAASYREDPDWNEPMVLWVEVRGNRAYHGTGIPPGVVLREGLRPTGRTELFFSDDVRLARNWAHQKAVDGKGYVYSFPWPEMWQDRWLYDSYLGSDGDFWTSESIPADRIEVHEEVQL